MTTIVERTPKRITVSMSTRRWNRMLELEQAYKLARIIKRSMKQVEEEPSMTPEEAAVCEMRIVYTSSSFRLLSSNTRCSSSLGGRAFSSSGSISSAVL